MIEIYANYLNFTVFPSDYFAKKFLNNGAYTRRYSKYLKRLFYHLFFVIFFVRKMLSISFIHYDLFAQCRTERLSVISVSTWKVNIFLSILENWNKSPHYPKISKPITPKVRCKVIDTNRIQGQQVIDPWFRPTYFKGVALMQSDSAQMQVAICNIYILKIH